MTSYDGRIDALYETGVVSADALFDQTCLPEPTSRLPDTVCPYSINAVLSLEMLRDFVVYDAETRDEASDEPLTLDDMLVDGARATIEDTVIYDETFEGPEIEKDLYLIDRRRRAIVTERFGLQGEPKTLKELAKEYGVTRERIRRLQIDGVSQLRRNAVLGQTRLGIEDLARDDPQFGLRTGLPLSRDQQVRVGYPAV